LLQTYEIIQNKTAKIKPSFLVGRLETQFHSGQGPEGVGVPGVSVTFSGENKNIGLTD
jgi:hypothetical protein